MKGWMQAGLGGTPSQLRRWLALNVLLLALVGLLSLSYPVEELSRRFGDFYFRLRGTQSASSQVALVLIDDASLAHYGRWPWPRSLLAQLVRAASAAHPRAVGLDILLSEPEDENNDRDLANALNAAGNVVLADKIADSIEGPLWVEPLPRFVQVAAGVGHVHAALGPDGVCRAVPVRELSTDGPRWAFALEVARVARGATLEEGPDGLRLGQTRVPVEGPAPGPDVVALQRTPPQFVVIDYRRQSLPGQPSFVSVAASDLLSGKAGEQLRGKAVLIGFGATQIGDRLLTPVSDQLPMPGVEIHANLVDALLDGRSLQPAGMALQLFFLVGGAMLSTWFVLRWPGWLGLLALAGLLPAGYAVVYLLFVHAHRLLEFGPLLCAGVLAGPLAQLENLFTVDRGLTRGLRQLKQALQDSPDETGHALRAAVGRWIPAPAADLHWKLALLDQLQAELVSLYTFDQKLLEAMHEGLAVFTPHGRQIFRNSQWQKFCVAQNWDASASLEEFSAQLHDPGWSDLHERLVAPRARLEREVQLGETLWYFRALPLPWTSHAGSPGILVMVGDLTSRLERDRARAEALSFVTHELRTPLVAVQGFAEYMVRYPEVAANSEAPATILRESKRLVAMIDTYLDVIRLDAGSRPVRQEMVRISEVVSQVHRIIQPLARAAGITVKVEMDSGLPSLRGDADLIAGALLNLLSNAVKYSKEGSEVGLRVLPDGPDVAFEVWNPGPGIPPQYLARLFEPFYRSPAHKDSTPGFGLGLAFVKRIAEGHGGRVEASSGNSTGTCFRMLLPGGLTTYEEALR